MAARLRTSRQVRFTGVDAPVIERKIKPDGSVREYPCRLVDYNPRRAVLRFDFVEGGAFSTPLGPIEAGAVSYGWFWAARPYDLYRILGAGGEVLGHRLEAVAGLRISPEVVEYRDLVLDWWALPDGCLVEEDREEFETLKAAGGLGAADVARAEAAARQVLGRYRHIIDEVERI